MPLLSVSPGVAPRGAAPRPRCARRAGSRSVTTMNSTGKVFVVGNWACNGSHKMVKKLVDELNKQEQVDEGVGEPSLPPPRMNPKTL